MPQHTLLATPILAAAVITGSVTGSLRAQQVEPDTVPPVGLDTITVSVMRVPLPLYRIPYAVSVVSDSMANLFQPRLALGETLTGVPGVQVQNRYNYAQGDRVSVRGLGARTPFGIRGVRILVDGIPATLADGQTTLDQLDLSTVDRIEAIRGPSSSLYGNASGGVIRFESLPPTVSGFRQRFGALGGSNGLVRLESSTLAQAGPATLALDVTAFSYDGYRAHAAADKLLASGQIRYLVGDNELRLVTSFVDFDALNPGSLTDSLLAVDRSMANPFNVIQQTGKQARQGQVGLAWTNYGATGDWHASAYGVVRDLYNTIPVSVIEIDRLAGGARLQHERRTRLGKRTLHWTVGVETAIQRDDRRNFENEQGDKGSITIDQDQRVWNLGPFLQLGVPVVDRVNLQTGVRYDRVWFTAADNRCSSDTPACYSERTMDAWSPSLGLIVRASQGLDLFGNIATAFETPTTTELGNTPDGAFGYNQDLNPQRVVSLELGTRGRIAAELSFSTALYWAQVTDALVPFEVPQQPGRSFFQNAGSAVHRGVELSAALEALTHFTLTAAYSYTDARFDDFTVADQVYDGNRVPGVAPHLLQLFASYDPDAKWYVASDLVVAFRTPVNDANTAHSPAYVVIDVRAGIHQLALGWLGLGPYLGISNLLNTEYNSSVVVNAFAGRYYEPGPPRSLWLGVHIQMRAP
jgi:iron complex outermembrane receptor protein